MCSMTLSIKRKYEKYNNWYINKIEEEKLQAKKGKKKHKIKKIQKRKYATQHNPTASTRQPLFSLVAMDAALAEAETIDIWLKPASLHHGLHDVLPLTSILYCHVLSFSF